VTNAKGNRLDDTDRPERAAVVAARFSRGRILRTLVRRGVAVIGRVRPNVPENVRLPRAGQVFWLRASRPDCSGQSRRVFPISPGKVEISDVVRRMERIVRKGRFDPSPVTAARPRRNRQPKLISPNFPSTLAITNRECRALVPPARGEQGSDRVRENKRVSPVRQRMAMGQRHKKMASMGLIAEFKTFIVKGNAIDLAVGLILGAAFGGVVNSLVTDVIMPPIGVLLGGVDFSSLHVTLAKAVPVGEKTMTGITNTTTKEIPAAVLSYGKFINALIALLIQGFVVFMIVKSINKLKRKEAVAPSTPPAPSTEEKLLTEIRDLLAAK
jgi:large conductance mechanosensitive channel